MTTSELYCRHCAEPTCGPRESDGVCQRCGETDMPSPTVADALAEYSASYDGHPDSPTPEHVAHVAANPIDVVGHLTHDERLALYERAAELPEVSGGPDAEDDAPDWDRLRADEAEDRIASTAATDEPVDSLAAKRTELAIDDHRLADTRIAQWFEATKNDQANERLRRSFERAYPAAKRLGSDGPDDGGQS